MFYRAKTGSFGVGKPINGEAASIANGGTISFAVDTTEQADAWHAAGIANGGVAIESPPGIRGMGAVQLYLAYLRDPGWQQAGRDEAAGLSPRMISRRSPPC